MKLHKFIGFVICVFAVVVSCNDVVVDVEQPEENAGEEIVEGSESWEETLTVASEKCIYPSGYALFYIKKDSGAQWEMFDDSIKGFDYEPGYEYVIVVKVTMTPEPPEDAPDRTYSLVRIVSKEKKDSDVPVYENPTWEERWTVSHESVVKEDGSVCLKVMRDSTIGWETVCTDISGFEYEAGYEYVIQVKITDIRINPMESVWEYELVSIISRNKV